ncbi:MAG TPA: GNAT family N-acetyltransferase [Burkholderiales bacterium]|nr:GNAT family N-acetyltransferase [Burkholderiales bacterium]
MIELRQASSSGEIEVLRGLFREYQRWVDEPCCFASFEQELAGLPGEYAPPAGRLLLASEAGAPAGCAALRRLDAQTGEMKRLYVRPAYRGRGLGRQLAAAVIDAARETGYASLVLDTLPKMASAIALYRALAFAPRGPYSAQPTPGAIFFERRL